MGGGGGSPWHRRPPPQPPPAREGDRRPAPPPSADSPLSTLAHPATEFGGSCVRPAFASPSSTPFCSALSAAALALFLWWATAGLLDRQTEAAIQADAQSLSERFNAGRIPALILTIEERLTQNVEDDAIYLLVDPSGQRIAGNLEHWPQGAAHSDAWYELPIERAGIRSLALVQSFTLPGGFRLLVGRDVQVRAQLRRLLTDALLWALLVVLVMASVGALVVRSLFRRTLANVSATASAIAAGDFTQRVRCPGAATSSTSSPRRSTTCWTGSGG